MHVSHWIPQRVSSTKSQVLTDFSIQELRIRRVAPTTRCMAPKRRNRFEGHASNECRFIPSVTYGKVEVGLRWHVKNGNLDRFQRLLYITAKPRCRANIVFLPSPALQNEVVRIAVKARTEAFDSLFEVSSGRTRRTP